MGSSPNSLVSSFVMSLMTSFLVSLATSKSSKTTRNTIYNNNNLSWGSKGLRNPPRILTCSRAFCIYLNTKLTQLIYHCIYIISPIFESNQKRLSTHPILSSLKSDSLQEGCALNISLYSSHFTNLSFSLNV